MACSKWKWSSIAMVRLMPNNFENLDLPYFSLPSTFKGTVPRDFRLQVFFMYQFPLKPLSIPLRLFWTFSKICGDIHRCTGGKWKKSSIRKVLIIFMGHLWVEELAYRYIFLQVQFKGTVQRDGSGQKLGSFHRFFIKGNVAAGF